MTIFCLALGNPTPQISLYIGGHLVRQETVIIKLINTNLVLENINIKLMNLLIGSSYGNNNSKCFKRNGTRLVLRNQWIWCTHAGGQEN